MLTDGVVSLRQWHPDDAEWYVEHSRDPEIRRWNTEPPDLDSTTVRRAIDRALADRLVAVAITDAATGELLGNLALSPEHELSYWVASAARGRGVATRAVRLLLDHAWASGVDRVVLHPAGRRHPTSAPAWPFPLGPTPAGHHRALPLIGPHSAPGISTSGRTG